MKGILGKKLGMTQIFGDGGVLIPVTVIEAGPCTVIQKKTKVSDGYEALQIGWGLVRELRSEKKKNLKGFYLNKPMKGHFLKQGERSKVTIKPCRYLKEIKADNVDNYQVGQEIKVNIFENGEKVDVIGTTKGKGFAGAMKRWKFGGGGKSHGSMSHRKPCSNSETNCARVVRGSRRPGHMGNARYTALGLTIVRVDPNRNLLLIRGTVPGSEDGHLIIRNSVKSK